MPKKWVPNRITPPKQTPWFVKLFMHLTGGFALLMYMCALGSFIMYPLQPHPTATLGTPDAPFAVARWYNPQNKRS